MKVILIKSVQKIGKIDDIVDVSDGYANNSLFPNKLAIPATNKNLESLKKKKQSNSDLKAFEHELIQKAISSLPNTTLEIKVKANEKGHLFSKIDKNNILEALSNHRIYINENNIVMDDTIKKLGNYEVQIKEDEYKTKIIVSVIQE